MAYIAAIVLELSSPEPLLYAWSLIALALYGAFLGSYGYCINTYSDRKDDERVGKHPHITYFTPPQHLAIVVFFGIGALAIPFLYSSWEIKALGVVNFLLASLYSIRPFRLKERGIFGPLTATIVQRPLLFLFFALLVPWKPLMVGYLLGWLLLSGLLVEYAQQLIDYENDHKAGVKTWAQNIGYAAARRTTQITKALTIIYTCIPPLLFGLEDGLVTTMILAVFSRDSFIYVILSLKTKNPEQK